MARIALPDTAFSKQPTGKHSKPVKDKGYLAWLHELPCLVTRTLPVQAAHISYAEPKYGKLGRGKSQKESDRWAVPLCSTEHERQHKMNERKYWQSVGIDPCVVALALYDAYPNTHLAILVIQNARGAVLWP
jgi:hypothetical protein